MAKFSPIIGVSPFLAFHLDTAHLVFLPRFPINGVCLYLLVVAGEEGGGGGGEKRRGRGNAFSLMSRGGRLRG